MRSKLALILTGVILGASSVALCAEYKKYKRFKETLEAETDFKSEAEAKAKKHSGICPFTKTACEFGDCDGCKNDIRPIYDSEESADDIINTISALDPESPSFDADLKRVHDKLDAVLDKYDIKKSDEPIYKGSDTSAEEDFDAYTDDESIYNGSDTPAEEDFDAYTDDDMSDIEEVSISDAAYSSHSETAGTSSFYNDEELEENDVKEDNTTSSDEENDEHTEDTAAQVADTTTQEEKSGTVDENEVPIFLENDADEDISDNTL